MAPDNPAQEALALVDIRRTLGVSGGENIEFHLPALHLPRGGALAITGPSGCGKSTLLNIISGLLPSNSGETRVLGTELRDLRPAALDAFRGRHFGFVYQTFNLLDPFSAEENVLLALRFGRSVARGDRHRRAREVLARVGLERRLHNRPAQLSVGERQRVAIARAIANHPDIILADEPTGALDPDTARDVFQLLLAIVREENATLVLVTHDQDLAQLLPTRLDCSHLIVRGRAR